MNEPPQTSQPCWRTPEAPSLLPDLPPEAPPGSGLGSPTAVSLPRHPGAAAFEPRACLFQHPGPLTATAHPSAPGRLSPAFSGAARCGGRELTARAGFTLDSHEPCLRRDIPGKPVFGETAAVLAEGQETCAPVPAWPPVPAAAVRPEVPAQCSLGPSEPGTLQLLQGRGPWPRSSGVGLVPTRTRPATSRRSHVEQGQRGHSRERTRNDRGRR